VQTWRDVDGLPPFPKEDSKETPKSEEGEASEEEEETGGGDEDDEVMDSDPEPAARTRGQKRAAEASSLSAHEEEEESEKAEETATSPKKRKSPSQLAEEKRCKRMRQTSILDIGVGLTPPMGKVLETPEVVGGGLKTLPVSK
jgi:hypothetical protein